MFENERKNNRTLDTNCTIKAQAKPHRPDNESKEFEIQRTATAETVPPNWPERIECEMNVDEWESSLKRAGLLNKYKDVIHGFRHGFDQGIPEHVITGTQFYTPKNHTSSLLVSEKIMKNIEKEISKKRMYGPFSHEEISKAFSFYRSNPLGAVVNGDGSVRPINDLLYPRNVPGIPSVNSFVNKMDFVTTWDDFA